MPVPDPVAAVPNSLPGQAAPSAIPFYEAFKFWLKLGFISFGGPAGQIAIMHRELVEEKRWISEKRFLHALNYCMLLPGPEAQQLATYMGWLMHRTWGGVVAGVLFVLPSLFILVGLSWIYVVYGHVPWVAGVLYGIKPAVAAIVLQAVHRIGSKILRKPAQAPVLWVVAAMSFVALVVFNIPFPWVVLAAALMGWLGQRWVPKQFGLGPAMVAAHLHPQSQQRPPLQPGALNDKARGHAPGAVQGVVPQGLPDYVLGDDTPTPEHARFKPARLARVLGAAAVLWLIPMALLVAWQGWAGTLTQMGWFFTKAALMTFGGAYAVLPYVYQGGVEQFGWLTGPQMMDGLALGETTPGPLIMVVAFVGFLGGWSQQVLGPQALFWGAALAAVVVTWFTFLPSFIFILAGGPLVESTHGRLQFTAPLTAITAAVVGVIASLALFFIVHIAYQTRAGGLFGLKVDLIALGLVLLASVALLRYKLGVVTVIGLSGLTGLGLRLAGWV